MWSQPMPQSEFCLTGVTWHLGPVYSTGNATSKPYLSTVEAKKFWLYRSLFDLVHSLHCLELQDKRLMAWYFNLSDEDRKIIQEEGGLNKFLLGHPALEVSKHIGIVHVKSQIRRAALKKSAKLNNPKYPKVKGVSCKNCGTRCPSDSETGRTFDPVDEVETYLTGQKTEPGVWGGNSHGATGDQVTQAQRFSNEWRKGQSTIRSTTASALKDTSAQTSFSLDVEPECHSQMFQASSPPACPNRQVECETVTDNRSYLDLGQEMPPEYYNFNSTMSDETSVEWVASGIQSAKHDGVDSAVSVSCHSCPLEWTNLDATADESPQNNPICSQAQRVLNEWREGQSTIRRTTVSALKDTLAQTSFSLDVEPECHSQMFQASSPPACPNCQVECETVTDNRSYLDLGQEMPPEYYSFNSTMSDETSAEWVANGIQSAEHDGVDSAVSVSCHSCPLEWTNLDATADKSPQNKPRDEFHSVTEESGPPEGTHASPSQKPQVDQAGKLDVGKGQQTLRKDYQSVDEPLMFISPDESGEKLPVSAALHPATVSQAVDATSDFRACFTSTQECEAIPSTTDASTETGCLDQDTQTIPTPTAEKSTITEVYIADLDFLTKEFLRLKSVEEELEQLKANQLKPTMECGCECGQRLKQANLKLLALQYSMCQDHCWRRYYNSGQRETELQCTGGIPESLAETLHALEQDYIQMRRQVLSGVALDDLTPLSVDTHRLNTESRYTPAQKMNEYLEDKVPFESTARQLKNETNMKMDSREDDKAGRPGININSKKDALGKPGTSHTKPGGDTSSMGVSVKTQKSDTHQSSESSRPGSPEEGGGITSEDWYDAEEDVGPAGQGLKEKQLRKVMKSEGNGKVGDGDGRKISSHLCIADLPNDVTEEDLLLLLKKYQPKEVCFTMSNTSRTATVTMSCPENAEAALQDLSGSSIHGQPIQVRRISRLPAAGPEGDRTFKKPHTPSATRPADSGNMPKPGSVKETTPYNMSPKPIRYHIEKLVNISDVPTATGTYVPQQPPANTTTMGSFSTLMVQLSERHPEVARQTFVEALLELRAQHRGSLSGLPLSTIVEMTSGLLTAQVLGSK